MRIGFLLIFGLSCLVGLVADALASIFGMIALLKSDNQISNLFMALAGICITSMVCGTKYVIRGEVPIVLCVLWVLCMGLDIITNVIGLVHFIVNNGAVDAPVSLSLDEVLSSIRSNPEKGGFAAILLALFTGSSVGCAYVFDENGKK